MAVLWAPLPCQMRTKSKRQMQAASYEDSRNVGRTRSGNTFVEERIGNKLVQRYLMNEESFCQIKRTGDRPRLEKATGAFDLKQAALEFVLPAGFPDSVSEDYLRYMLWQLPTNITAWICRALITSSLLQAVGLSAGAGPTAAAAAAVKWVTKDGLGAVGRLFVGGRFGGVFDEDPKQWRMYAEFVGSFGGLFELATPLVPDYFLPLASLGHLTKAIARGLKDPSFRVIQNHFAMSENVGDVAAKEEVWEVAGQLIGLSLGVGLLSSPVVTTSYSQLALSWALIRSFHLWLRYQSLAALELPTLNYKRLTILITEHVQGLPLSGVSGCNKKENVILARALLEPTIRLGCTLQDIAEFSADSGSEVLDLYNSEKHILGVCKKEVRILLKEGWSNVTVLRSMYQAHCGFLLNYQTQESLAIMQTNFASFTEELSVSGWSVDKLVIKIPAAAPVYKFVKISPS